DVNLTITSNTAASGRVGRAVTSTTTNTTTTAETLATSSVATTSDAKARILELEAENLDIKTRYQKLENDMKGIQHLANRSTIDK
ncbi:14034_t:CDS:2, partial [Gigaspora margarita]